MVFRHSKTTPRFSTRFRLHTVPSRLAACAGMIPYSASLGLCPIRLFLRGLGVIRTGRHETWPGHRCQWVRGTPLSTGFGASGLRGACGFTSSFEPAGSLALGGLVGRSVGLAWRAGASAAHAFASPGVDNGSGKVLDITR